MEKLVVMDYSDSSVTIYETPEDKSGEQRNTSKASHRSIK